jgi:hypothetical protein
VRKPSALSCAAIHPHLDILAFDGDVARSPHESTLAAAKRCTRVALRLQAVLGS